MTIDNELNAEKSKMVQDRWARYFCREYLNMMPFPDTSYTHWVIFEEPASHSNTFFKAPLYKVLIKLHAWNETSESGFLDSKH